MVRGSSSSGGKNLIKMRRIVQEYVARGLKAPRLGFDTQRTGTYLESIGSRFKSYTRLFVENELIMGMFCVTDKWAGVYSDWEQIKHEERKMLEKLHRT